jgi:hypothetical protein
MLAVYGPVVDGFVWDETFYVTIGEITLAPRPAYCDRAMLALVRDLRKHVEERHPQKAFLVSDCLGLGGAWTNVPGYAMVAHGTYQDTHCDPVAWSYGLFPNWRNALWSCNWSPISAFALTRFGVESYGTPVAISNGWGDGRGPSEWRPWERSGILGLFRSRLHQGPRVRYLGSDPAVLLEDSPERPAPGDAIPEPGPDEANWALASNGSRAQASSVDDYGGGDWGPAGVIDGIRDGSRWGNGGGWAAKIGEPLPQWLEIDLGAPRLIRRFVVVTYQHEGSAETVAKWGVRDYRIEAFDDASGGWRTMALESGGRMAKARVHEPAHPMVTSRIRIVVTRVAPLDGAARLLELEAWGPKG